VCAYCARPLQVQVTAQTQTLTVTTVAAGEATPLPFSGSTGAQGLACPVCRKSLEGFIVVRLRADAAEPCPRCGGLDLEEQDVVRMVDGMEQGDVDLRCLGCDLRRFDGAWYEAYAGA